MVNYFKLTCIRNEQEQHSRSVVLGTWAHFRGYVEKSLKMYAALPRRSPWIQTVTEIISIFIQIYQKASFSAAQFTQLWGVWAGSWGGNVLLGQMQWLATECVGHAVFALRFESRVPFTRRLQAPQSQDTDEFVERKWNKEEKRQNVKWDKGT